MTPQELKNSILQLAIQGKLVEQRPDEGTAEELYRQIQANSIATVKSTPAFSDDELRFDIPESWKYVRIENIAILHNGRAYKQNELLEKGKYPVLRVGNLFTNNKWYYSNLELEPEKYCDKGDLLYAWSASFGPYIWDGEKSIYHYHIWKIEFSRFIDKEYFYYFLLADTDSIKRSGHGLAMIHVTKAGTEKRVFPLPPLAEQKRIVVKIKELLPLIDRYEKAWSRLEAFNKRFPGDMQKSLLQMAIQGKLVEQRPEEGTGEELFKQIQREKQALVKAGKIKKEKLLPEITEDEIPFDIPESWKWVRLATVTNMLAGFAFKSEDFKQEGKSRLLRGINLGVNAVRWKDVVYVDTLPERVDEYKLESGDVLLGLDRPWISDGTRAAIYDDDKETYLVQRVLRIRGQGHLTSPFVSLLLHSSLLNSPLGGETTGISVPHISPNQVGCIVVPLPPLAEQKRIVAQLEELLPLCERLRRG